MEAGRAMSVVSVVLSGGQRNYDSTCDPSPSPSPSFQLQGLLFFTVGMLGAWAIVASYVGAMYVCVCHDLGRRRSKYANIQAPFLIFHFSFLST
jgi:hypothetical protein